MRSFRSEIKSPYSWFRRSALTLLLLFSSGIPAVYAQQSGGDTLINSIHSFKPKDLKLDTSIINLIHTDGLSSRDLIRVSTGYGTLGHDNLMLHAAIEKDVVKDDVLWLSFEIRCLQSKRETGEGVLVTSVNRTIDHKDEWPPLLERSVSVGKSWTTVQIPFIANRSVSEQELTISLNFGNVQQRIEVSSLILLNYKKDRSYASLPRSVVHYDGDMPDAPWRKEAEERIKRIRQISLTLKVTDRQGRSVRGASIHVRMTKSAFAWGTALNSKRVLDQTSADSKKFRDTLVRYFNKVVFENELKWKYWDRYDHSQTIKAAGWLKKNNIDLRGHVMVWPSWQHSPPFLFALRNDTAALALSVIRNIREQAQMMRGQFKEWDIINEPYAHHDLIDILGRSSMVNWFMEARRDLPNVRLFLNDYTMFQGTGQNSPSEQFYNNVKYLKEAGAPIQAIGEQGHIGGVPPGIPYVISRLDHFATLGLPIQISEFDITSDDDHYKAAYMKDFMTAVFSHQAVIGLVQWGFWEKEHWIPPAALWDKNWNIRPNGKVFIQLVGKTWATDTTGVTDHEGRLGLRVFKGSYEITLKKGKRVVVKQAALDSISKVIEITL